jgi:ATP-binding cassette subfamily A (ABC1) protein 3
MVLFAQAWVLTRKNLLITLNRHTLSTIFVAFILPICIIAFLSYARNLFIPPSEYGIGNPTPIRTLAEGLQGATGGRDTVAFVNNGFAGGEIDQVIDDLVQQVEAVGRRAFRLANDNELIDTCPSTLRGSSTCYGAVVFQGSPTEGGGDIWNYTIRADGAFGSKVIAENTDNEVQVYLLPLQRAVDAAIVGISAPNNPLPTVDEYIFTSMTQEERRVDIRVRYQGAIINVIGIAFLVGMVFITYHMTGFIAAERELGMSQLIEAMMPNKRRWQPQLARILAYHWAFDMLYLPGWIIIGVILGVGVFAATNLGVVIIFHVLTGLSFASFSIFISSFFKKAQLSGITCCILTLVLGIVAQIMSNPSTGAVAILSFLFPSCNYVNFTVIMARFERQEMPLNLTQAAPENNSTLPGIAMWVFFILQIILYPIFGMLIERAFYGTASKGRVVVRGGEAATTGTATVQLDNFSKHYRPNWFRRKFAGFTKTPKDAVIAVNSLTLSANKGQICVLLGANGSGKSTTLDAIAGLNTVTSGTITVDGTGGVGIAPQKNVLWDELTVEEHIKIFNRLKSPKNRDNKEQIRELIRSVDLDRKVKARSKTLSGGQKRKLQLGMMFTGGSAVCCVDEVSSGLDPLSRRKVWDILLAERGTRTILLCTHFLDEADLLADQIAILSKGTLRAQGSSVALKEEKGGGYRLQLSTGPGSKEAPEIDGVSTYSTFGQTLYYAPTSRHAANIIKRLEAANLTDYQLSGPTIEDVFLKLADEVHAETEGGRAITPPEKGNEVTRITSNALARDITREGRDLNIHTGQKIGLGKQAWVLFRKRFTILRRNYLPYIAALLLPIIAAGLVTLFVANQQQATCSQESNLDFDDIRTFASQRRYDILLGPASTFTNETIVNLFSSLLPPGVSGFLSPGALSNFVTTVDTLEEFNSYIAQNFRNVTPAGVFLGDTPTIAYRGNNLLYAGIFGQNILDSVVSNLTIATQYAAFDIPWVADTGDSLQVS